MSKQDTLTEIADSIAAHRRSATILLNLGGHPTPTTEREWLLFSTNHNLRSQGAGKPLAWNPPEDDDTDD